MFDNIADLIDKIRLGEDSYLELKEVRFAGQKVSAPHRDSLADELAAFANSRGGVCVLGVDDTREVVGITLERLDLVEDFVRQICLDSITPPLAPVIERLNGVTNAWEERLDMFDNIADLIDKIRLGEDSYLELKEVRFAGERVSAPHRDSLADELAAFANS
ncbi:MAG: hypothetical protein RIR00_406, partial [Pseudomonadota bacterium]